MSSGSDHMRSQNGPSCGISHTRSIVRICVKAEAVTETTLSNWVTLGHAASMA
jgi:hypothetical protein